MGRLRLSLSSFIKRLSECSNDEYEYIEGYTRLCDHVTLRHKVCGTVFTVKASSFICTGSRCPNCCKKNTRYTIEELQEKIGNNFTALEIYVDDKTKHKVRCNKCGVEFYIHQNRFKKFIDEHDCNLYI